MSDRAVYRWSLATRTAGESGSGTLDRERRFHADVDVRILASRKETRARAAVTIKPVSATVDGVEVPLPDIVAVEVDLLAGGGIASTNPGGAEIAASDLLIEMWPPLPRAPVAIGESWDAAADIRGRESARALRGSARLVRFRLQDRATLAELELNRFGRAAQQIELERHLEHGAGDVSTQTSALVDIETGLLYESVTRSILELAFGKTGGSRTANVRVEATSTITRLLNA